MSRWKQAAASLLLLLLGGCAAQNGEDNAYRQVTMDEAVQLMETETDYLVVDVRTPEEFEEKHIPGAVLVPNESIADEPPAALPDREQMLLIYCRSGNRSKQAAAKLAALGYTNVIEFGGINSWTGETVSGAV